MKLNQVLTQINLIERSKFINCLDQILKDNKDSITDFSNMDCQLRQASESQIISLFSTVSTHYKEMIRERICFLGSQANLLLNILSRDGNCVVRIQWIESLYEKENSRLEKLSLQIEGEIKESANVTSYERATRLSIYYDCFETAYRNDERLNREAKVTDDERTILNTLAARLNLSSDDVFAIENLIEPLPKGSVEATLELLKESGILFISKKKQEVFVADEVIAILHEIQNKQLSDKYALRILRSLSDAELSNAVRCYGQKSRGVSRSEKIHFIVSSGISIRNVLSIDIHDKEESLNIRKDRIKGVIEDLGLLLPRLGVTVDDRIDLMINSIKANAEKEFDMLSISGFSELLKSLEATDLSVLDRLRREFEIEDREELSTETLRALSISPLDILYLYNNDEVKAIRDEFNLSKRINPRVAIIEHFASANDKLVDHYVKLAKRDLSGLKEVGIDIKESEIGVKFEEITRSILSHLQLNVDEDLRKEVNTAKDKADIVVSIGNDDVIIGEVKSHKNGDYAKYSTISRQVKAYVNRFEESGKRVAQVLIIAPSFSPDFIESAELDTEINISLLEAEGLKKILDAFRSRNKPKFTAKLLTKGGLLKADLIAKAI
jgi:hypothetical protein